MAELSLKERLRQAVAVHTKASSGKPSGEPSGSPVTEEGLDPRRSPHESPRDPPDRSESARQVLEELLGGTWHETDGGPVFIRDEIYPSDHVHGRLALNALLDRSRSTLSDVLREDQVPAISKLGFLDLETTGLSAGTGTYFFLAGLGAYTESGFRVRQYFLADLRHERAMLAALAHDLRQLDAVVTYNGQCFDLPCIDTRMLLAREASPIGDLMSFDLLYAVRRLYRHRLPTCRLADAEESLLRFERRDDLPGWMAPSIYFDYLRAGRIAPLRGVMRHNSDDILSLAALLAHLALLFDQKDLDPRDTAALARWWEYANQTERARSLYDAALPSLEGLDDWGWAAQRHALLCKRAGERGTAAGLWTRLWAQGNRRAGLELAMHLEHHARDLIGAESVTRDLLAKAEEQDHAALHHRLQRIEQKRERRERGKPPRRGKPAKPPRSAR